MVSIGFLHIPYIVCVMSLVDEQCLNQKLANLFSNDQIVDVFSFVAYIVSGLLLSYASIAQEQP